MLESGNRAWEHRRQTKTFWGVNVKTVSIISKEYTSEIRKFLSSWCQIEAEEKDQNTTIITGDAGTIDVFLVALYNKAFIQNNKHDSITIEETTIILPF